MTDPTDVPTAESTDVPITVLVTKVQQECALRAGMDLVDWVRSVLSDHTIDDLEKEMLRVNRRAFQQEQLARLTCNETSRAEHLRTADAHRARYAELNQSLREEIARSTSPTPSPHRTPHD